MITTLPTTFSVHERGADPVTSGVKVVQWPEYWACEVHGNWLPEGFTDPCPHVRRAMAEQRKETV